MGKKIMIDPITRIEGHLRIEVEVSEDQAQQISGGLDKIKGTFDNLQPILLKVCRPIVNTWKELNKEMSIEQAEVELGLSFEIDGNLFVTRSKAGANLSVKLILNPKETQEQGGTE